MTVHNLDNPVDDIPQALQEPSLAKATIRAAFYARVSCEQQSAAGTIDSQLALLAERIAQDGLDLEEEMRFIDDGYSGSTLVRPALERLRDAAASGVIDRLYIACPDRLARKCSLQMLLVEELEHCGVELVFLNRPIGRTPEDDLLLQMQGAVAEYERAKILERSRRGKLHAARRGRVSVLGKAPYGYRYISKVAGRGALPGSDAQFNVNLEEAEIVRQMFQWVGEERLSIRQVCRRLEKLGVCPPKGGVRWSSKSVGGMLHNPAYKGLAGYGKRCSGPMRPRPRPPRGACEQPRRARGWYSMPAAQWVSIPVPGIVEEQLFAGVGEQLEENRRRMRAGQQGARHLLQGLLVCSCCGYAYCGWHNKGSADVQGQTGTVNGDGRYAYYRCSGGRCVGDLVHKLCDNKALRAEWLDEAVWNDVRSLLEEPGRMQREFERRLQGEAVAGNSAEHQRSVALGSRLRRGIARLIDAYRDGLLEKREFEPRLVEARARLARLEAEVQSQEAAESAAREMRLVLDSLESFAQKVKSGLAEADWASKRELIRMLVKRIEIEKQQVRLVYKVDIRPFERGPERGIWKDCVLRARATPGWSLVPCPLSSAAWCGEFSGQR